MRHKILLIFHIVYLNKENTVISVRIEKVPQPSVEYSFTQKMSGKKNPCQLYVAAHKHDEWKT